MKLKKSLAAILSLTAIFSLSTGLVGCKKDNQDDNPPVTNNDETVVNTVLEGLSVPTPVTENFTLTTSGVGGVKISWSSANADVISIVGGNATVVRPTDKDVQVELTATASLNSVEKTKKFTVTVTMLEDTSMTVAEVLAAEDGTAVEVRGVVTGIAYQTSTSGSDLVFGTQGYWVSDNTGSIYVYGNSEVAKGNLVSIKGTKKIDTYNEAKGVILHEITSPEVTVLKESETAPAFSYATEITIAELNALTEGCAGKVYKIIAAPKVYKNTNGGYVNFELLDAAGKYINEYANTSKGNLDINAERYEQFADYYDNDGVTKICYFAIQGKNSKGTAWRGNLLGVEDYKLPDDEQALADANSALTSVSSKYTEVKEVTLNVKSNVVISVAANDYVSYADGKLKITALPDEAVEVTVKATATVNGVTKEATKTVTVQKPTDTPAPTPSGDVVSQLNIVDKKFSDTTWTYISNNPTDFPNPGFYGTAGKQGLKVNFENMGVKSGTFEAQNKVVVNVNIYALNPNTKTSSSTDFFTIKGYNAAGEVVATAKLNSVAVGDNAVTLEGLGIVCIDVVMTGYPTIDGTAQNVNLGGVTVSKAA